MIYERMNIYLVEFTLRVIYAIFQRKLARTLNIPKVKNIIKLKVQKDIFNTHTSINNGIILLLYLYI